MASAALTALASHGPRTAGYAVVCRGVTKDFGAGDSRVQALRGIDLEIPPGEMSLLVGPSGCGKTTLISIIAGLLDPTAGTVEVLGQDFEKLRCSRKAAFRGQNIGFVFQQYNLLPALTAAENAAVPLLILGMARKRAVLKARQELEDGRRAVDDLYEEARKSNAPPGWLR